MDGLAEIKGDRFIVELMYASEQNMTGRAVYKELGLGNRALVQPVVWAALQKAVPWLEARHLKMKIFDAYRPTEAHLMLKSIIPQQGFFAETPDLSQHCSGLAIDVCLCTEAGTELVYPTRVDAYTPEYARQVQAGDFAAFTAHLQKARHDYDEASDEAQRNREELCHLMESLGFQKIMHEWWHYNFSAL